ncbi:response regulator transcription factor [Oceanobacillus halotolerans]|uniref:response regulator transcription factor n=1 Tax=Oceanobacillus halotolerans TaxID=2663380 RepID=UPI0013DCF022|nr:response regulator transcription factor [Oceanobacillus halotolerans]
MVNITIIKDDDVIRNGIANVLQNKLEDCSTRELAVEDYKSIISDSSIPDLVIVDIDSNVNMNAIVNYCEEHQIKVAVWTTTINKDQLIALFKQGLHGYFYNGMEMSELLFAIKTMLNNEQYIHPHLSSVLLNEYINVTSHEPRRPNGVLSEREWDVLEQICQGHNNKSIANNLFISCKTVNNHVISIFRKLHVPDRTNAALLAVKNKWVSL